MRKLNTILVDDQEVFLEKMKSEFRKIEYVELTGSFTNPMHALRFLRVNPVDLVILDVEMEGMNGFEFMDAYPKKEVLTILCTAHQKFEELGYNKRVVDVLFKPVEPFRLKVALQRARDALKIQILPRTSQPVENEDNYDYFHLSGPAKSQRERVYHRDIIYLSAVDGMVEIRTINRQSTYMCYRSLKDIIEGTSKGLFLRCSRKFAFNVNFFHSYRDHRVYLNHTDEPLDLGKIRLSSEFRSFLDQNKI